MLIRILALAALIGFLSAKCTKNKIPTCESPSSIFDQDIFFYVKDNNGSNLIGSFGRTYESSFVKIMNPNYLDFKSYAVSGDGLISINPSEFSDSVGQKLSKTFFVTLPATSSNPLEDTDTLEIKYNILHSGCGTLWYDSVKVYYNQTLTFSGNYPYDILTLTKKN